MEPMKPDNRWQKLKQIFSEALELEGTERKIYLEKACRDDPELLQEVESLITSYHNPGLLDLSIDNVTESAFAGFDSVIFKGKKIGPYEIVGELGFGGMANVYLAKRADGQFDQDVALKLLRTGFKTENQVRRFLAERQILASLNHENIARLLDGGITGEGHPYYVMEYIEGQPIDEYCKDHRLPLQKRLELFLEVCEAVLYAHKKLIVHRDLKPSNIMVNREGKVKLLDFGIAKSLKPSDVLHPDAPPSGGPHTQPGILPLTPSYASPEQIRGEQVTAASDIYQLGVVLYELVCGHLPYEVTGKTPGEIEKTICETVPARPGTQIQKKSEPGTSGETAVSRLGRRLRADLDAIVMMALRKEPDRRYNSAEQLSKDLRYFLSGRPVSAHPDSRLYRFRKYVQRHSIGVSAAAAIFFSLMLGLGVALWQAHEAQTALAKTEAALNRAEALQEFLTNLFLPGALDRPAEQMPSTEELLQSGAQFALNEDLADPSERLSMLVTISEIYIQRGWPDEARPLIDAAVNLGRQHEDEWPQDLARALHLKARIASWDGDHDKSAQLYREAEGVLEGLDQHLDLFAEIRTARGYFEYYRGNYDRALEFAEPLYIELLRSDHPDRHLEMRVKNLLAITFGQLGELEKADVFQNQVMEAYRELDGEFSRTYAISLTNSIDLKYNLGQFDLAEQYARKALSVYNRIYDEPRSIMGVTWGKLSISLLLQGRYEESLSAVEQAGRYFAAVRKKDFDTWDVPDIYEGLILARMNRLGEAREKLYHVREHFAEGHHSMYFTSPTALLAGILCRTGQAEHGLATLAKTDPEVNSSFEMNPAKRAQYFESRAWCAYESGNMADALLNAKKSLEVMDYPGRVMERSDRKLLLAAVLSEMGRFTEASVQINKAKQLFHDSGLSGHPALAHVISAREQLIAETRLP